MKIKNMNSKAREAYGKSLIELSLSLNKAIFIFLVFAPLTFLARFIFIEGEKNISITFEIFDLMSLKSKILGIVIILALFFLAEFYRSSGIKHIHAAAEMEKKNN